MGTFGKAQANDTGDWNNNREMNPAANSSATKDGLLEDENTRTAGGDWRAEDEDEDADDATGDPGRTPGSAEGVEGSERTGNQ